MRCFVCSLLLVALGCDARESMDAEDVHALRASLIAHVWEDGLLPDAPPDLVDRNVSDPVLDPLSGLASIDRIQFDLEYETNSTLLYLRPEEPNGELMVYHLGHSQGFADALPAVGEFLEQGYAVLYCAMPLMGPNASAKRIEVGSKTIELRDHHSFVSLEEAGLRTMHLFLEPVARGIAHAIAEDRPSAIHMAGLSGGGWTTTVYAALDPRIEQSFDIAGSMPFSLRQGVDIGDFEQRRERPIYDLAGYRDLYVLGASGSGRARLQILNERDECCFATTGREDEIARYAEEVQENLDAIGEGGDFAFHIVAEQVEHAITEEALELIAERLHR